jgi:precorrin-6Y C5,15-methyltransferase (decarboxylating)
MTALAPAPAAGVAEPWLSVLGIGDDGLASLGPGAQALLAAGEVLVVGARHLALVPDHPAERLTWRSPLEATLTDIEARRGRRVVVLASGDPMCFGVGELLARHFPAAELQVLPAPSVISLACARLAWSRAEVEALSLHGRPTETLYRHLAPGARLIVLSNDGETPGRIAAMLAAQGWSCEPMSIIFPRPPATGRSLAPRGSARRVSPGPSRRSARRSSRCVRPPIHGSTSRLRSSG